MGSLTCTAILVCAGHMQGTDKWAPVLTGKNWKSALHPVTCRSITLRHRLKSTVFLLVNQPRSSLSTYSALQWTQIIWRCTLVCPAEHQWWVPTAGNVLLVSTLFAFRWEISKTRLKKHISVGCRQNFERVRTRHLTKEAKLGVFKLSVICLNHG